MLKRYLTSLTIIWTLGSTAAIGVVAQDNGAPRVLILTTGGTIASRRGAPTLDGTSLVEAVPELREHAVITVEEFSRIGSSQMTPAHWLRLSRRIATVFAADSDLAGIVVTHGTDTMEETAFFLHLTVHDPRPVVLVGSMRSANALSPDGPANLVNAVRIAAVPMARNQGVLIALNDEINSARDAWKTDNQRVQAFRSPQLGVLGFADADQITFYRSVTRPHTTMTPFDVRVLNRLPRVEIVADYAGYDGSTIDYLINSGVEGLIITGFGGGRLGPGARGGVERAVDLGIPVVVASRVPGGRITGPPAVPQTVLARDLSPQKARILLMLALTQHSTPDGIRGFFERY